jgi:hypothetical protein
MKALPETNLQLLPEAGIGQPFVSGWFRRQPDLRVVGKQTGK